MAVLPRVAELLGAFSGHPLQVACFAAFLVVDVAGLVILNVCKRRSAGSKPRAASWTWEAKKRCYWAYMAFTVSICCFLDSRFHISRYLLGLRDYAAVFPLGLIDFYFSDTSNVSPRVFAGALLWCSTLLIAAFASEQLFDVEMTHIVAEFSFVSLGKEFLRFIAAVAFVGLLSDMVFSPSHRLSHRIAYKHNHKRHHEYTNKLNSLVLYHGTMLDDFLMPLSTVVGQLLYSYCLHRMGNPWTPFSNLEELMLLFNTLFSHAHDDRCAGLILPLPAALNFSAYHRQHHLHPDKNFGLTLPSDLVWDAILGVDTIRKPLTNADEMKTAAAKVHGGEKSKDA